jgi:hypothetical protein
MARKRQRFLGSKTLGPGSDSLVADDVPGIDGGKSLKCESMAFLLVVNPGRKGLLHDPTLGAFELGCQLIYLVG